jgi:hypothetical protein
MLWELCVIFRAHYWWKLASGMLKRMKKITPFRDEIFTFPVPGMKTAIFISKKHFGFGRLGKKIHMKNSQDFCSHLEFLLEKGKLKQGKWM